MMNKNCPMTRCAVSTLAVFATMMLFNWLYHGHLLMNQYVATASLWRSEAEMQDMMWLCFLKQAVLSAIIVWIWGKNYQNLGTGEGVRFGVMIGALLGVHMAGAYISMPIPSSLALAWFAGEVLLGVMIGVVLSFTTRALCRTDADSGYVSPNDRAL